MFFTLRLPVRSDSYPDTRLTVCLQKMSAALPSLLLISDRGWNSHTHTHTRARARAHARTPPNPHTHTNTPKGINLSAMSHVYNQEQCETTGMIYDDYHLADRQCSLDETPPRSHIRNKECYPVVCVYPPVYVNSAPYT